MNGPKFPLEVFGEHKVFQLIYGVDAEGKCWSGSPRGWDRLSGDRQNVMSRIGAPAGLRGEHVKPYIRK
jgi:hypothetical protein